VKAAGRLHSSLVGLLAVGFALLLAALWLDDSQSLDQARALSDSLNRTEAERLEALVAERSLQTLSPQAVLIDGRRGEVLAALQSAAGNADLAAWASYVPAAPVRKRGRKSKAVPAAAPAPDPQAALESACQGMVGQWQSAELLDKSGRVAAVWPAPAPGAPSALGADESKDPYFKGLSDPSTGPGIPRYGFVKVSLAKDAGNSESKGKAPSKQAPAPHTAAQLVAACGIANQDGSFGGLLKIRLDARAALFGPAASPFDAFLIGSPHASVMVVRGNGEEIYNSTKDPFTENLAAVNGEYKALLASALGLPSGRQSVGSYDGQAGVMVWQRIGSAADGAAPEDVLSLLAFVPRSTFEAPGSALPELPKPFYERPLVLGLLLLAFLLPLLMGWYQLPAVLEPYAHTSSEARRVEEFAPIPELVLPDEPDPGVQAINRALGVLAKRVSQSEERVRELEGSLRRAEEEAARQAGQASQDLSELREKLSASQSAQQASDQKYEAAQKARQDAEAQLANLRSALETSTRNTELKTAENRNLGAQLQDLMRALEEQRKVAEKAQEGVSRKENEVVRLAAVNTLSSELKATLTVIKNYISTMLGSQGVISDAQQEFLGVVINKSARLERLIGDLVEISEIGSGAKPLHLEPVSPSALVQEALVNARPQAENKKISLELAESGTLSPIQVDKEKMEAVLRSLLSQAIKVTSRNEKIGLLLSERESTVELRVTDPGMSLPPDRAAKVFIQFHGVDSQAGPEFIGTGLRFPILKSVVEAHGGKLWIESQVGRGKTFVLVLPKAGANPAQAGPSAPAGPPPMATPPAPGSDVARAGTAPLGPPPAVPAVPAVPTAAAPKPGLPPLGPPPAAANTPAQVSPSMAAKLGIPPLGPPPAVPSPAPAAPASAVSKPAVAPLGPPPTSPPAAAPAAAAGAAAGTVPPPLPGLSAAIPVPPKPAAAPVIHKPAPVDETLNAPWKRKEVANDDLGELMDLPAVPTVRAQAAPLPPAPPLPGAPAAPSKPAEKADFERVFGAPPAQAAELKGGLPKVEFKTDAKPSDSDVANFSAVFGGAKPATSKGPAAPPVPPAGLGTPSPPPKVAGGPANVDFEKIFGSTPTAAPKAPGVPKPAAAPAASPPAPAKPAPVAKPPAASTADFDALFSAPAASAGPPAAPGAAPKPQPPAPAKPAAPGPGGLSTMDDLNRMLGQ
jgi:signal transduction histidine kinase